MSLDKTKEIDAIGIDKDSNRIVLSIIDEMDWNDEQKHLILLQEKINVYLSFVESGEVYSSYPDSEDRNFEIKVFMKDTPTDKVLSFLNEACEIIRGAGLIFSWKTILDRK